MNSSKHNYVRAGKFKHVNCPYALVNGIVFRSIFDAESYCTTTGLDVNEYIESDDPRVLAKCAQIAVFSLPVLRESLRRAERQREIIHADEQKIVVERDSWQAALDAKADLWSSVQLKLCKERLEHKIGEWMGCWEAIKILRYDIETLESVIRLRNKATQE